jgi:hypothetical protein
MTSTSGTNHVALVEIDWWGCLRKNYMYGILGDWNYYNFNDLETASLELTQMIHKIVPSFFQLLSPNVGN